MRCPCCNLVLTEVYRHATEWGVEESQYKCPKGCYVEIFGYGNTEVHILGFMTGWNHTTPREEVDKIHRRIKAIANAMQ